MKAEFQTVAVRASRWLTTGVLLGTLATSVSAFSSFRPGSPGTEKKVFCELTDISGTFSQTDARYVAKGICVQLQATLSSPTPGVKGESTFTDYSNAQELFRAAWTAEGGYDLRTKVAWEAITLPAPRTDEYAASGRPYGRLTSKRVCETDPWLIFRNAKCTSGVIETSGNLGDAVGRLDTSSGPFTKPVRDPQTQALIDAHDLYLKRYAQAVTPNTSLGRSTPKLLTLPEIILPPAGSTQPPQTPMRIRVAAPKNEGKVQSYQLQLESKQPNGQWATATNVPVSAAEVEGPLGYNGWGWHQPGTSAAMTAVPGAYRIRAQATAPVQGEPGAWREFTVAGAVGPAPDEFQVNKTKLANAKSGDLTGMRTAPGKTLSPPAQTALQPQQPQRGTTTTTTTTLGTANREGAALDWGKAAPSR